VLEGDRDREGMERGGREGEVLLGGKVGGRAWARDARRDTAHKGGVLHDGREAVVRAVVVALQQANHLVDAGDAHLVHQGEGLKG
jgi:hypothetical protein